MPITTQYQLPRMTREEFGQLAYSVLGDVFAIHNELGRFFDERIYKSILGKVREDVLLESWIDAVHRTFRKRYFVDAVTRRGGVFEFKSVDQLSPKHLGQLLNYLLLADQPHGLLVNLRPNRIEHHFVNNAVSRAERLKFNVVDLEWMCEDATARSFRNLLLEIIGDWGTGLEISLYEEALTHFLGGFDHVAQRIDVTWNSESVGSQLFRLAGPTAAFKLTAFEDQDSQSLFHEHLRRMMRHVALDTIYWANIARNCVTFRIVTR